MAGTTRLDPPAPRRAPPTDAVATPGRPGAAAGAAGALDGPTLDAVPDAVIVLDAHGAVAAANRAALRLTGFTASNLVGAPCATTLGARAASGWPLAAGWPRSSRLRSVRGWPATPLTLSRGDGTEVAVRTTGTYRRDRHGLVAGAVVCLRPEGGRSRAPTAIELLSAVSHELRSPLTSVKGYTGLLLHRWGDLTDGDKQMMLQQVERDADRVVRLITELLDVSRLETGGLVLRRRHVDLAGLAGEVVAEVGLAYPGLDATVSFGDASRPVWADPDKIGQVLVNLVENACKYGERRGVRIEGSRTGAGEVAVVVSDRGGGIASEDLPMVFTKFFRRPEAVPSGAGLGLWISRGLVEAHGGRLTASSRPGHGASFRFTIPIVDPEELQSP